MRPARISISLVEFAEAPDLNNSFGSIGIIIALRKQQKARRLSFGCAATRKTKQQQQQQENSYSPESRSASDLWPLQSASAEIDICYS